MNMIIQITTAIALILSIIVPFGCFFLGEKNKKRYKKSLIANCFMFFGVLLVATVVSFAGTASVQAAGSSADGLATRISWCSSCYRYFRSWFRYRRCKLRKCSSRCSERRRISLW